MRIEIGQIAEQRKSLRQRIATLDGQLQHGRMAIQSAQNELAGSDEQIVQTERGILASESAVSELYSEKEIAQKTSVQMHKEVQQLREEKIQRERTLKEKRIEQSELEDVMHRFVHGAFQCRLAVTKLHQPRRCEVNRP